MLKTAVPWTSRAPAAARGVASRKPTIVPRASPTAGIGVQEEDMPGLDSLAKTHALQGKVVAAASRDSCRGPELHVGNLCRICRGSRPPGIVHHQTLPPARAPHAGQYRFRQSARRSRVIAPVTTTKCMEGLPLAAPMYSRHVDLSPRPSPAPDGDTWLGTPTWMSTRST